jgi:hypothetical protein
VLSNPAVLGTADASGCWAWAGMRLSAEGRITATQRFPDLSWDERRRRVGAEEAAWLAAQWEPPSPGDRFEVRFATGPRADKVRAALLVRTHAAGEAEARERALARLARAADPNGALPPHVGAAAIEAEAELRTWLEYPKQVGGVVELRKHLSVRPIGRGGSSLRAAVCHGFFAEGAAWDAWWRRFAALRFRAVLCVGFDVYDAANPALQGHLQRRTLELEDLAVARTPSPVNPNPVPAEPAARLAAPGYRRALSAYRGRCFLVRVALVTEQPAPPALGEALARTISSVEGAVVPVHVAAQEIELVLREHRGLGAPWLPVTYQQHLHPVRVDAVDQVLHSLADVTEASAVLSLPVHWPGMPAVFDAVGSELCESE